MIKIVDIINLTRTKLKSKKLILFITIIIPSILFCLIYTSIIITNGTSDSLNSYIKKSQNGKYLVKAEPNIPSDIFTINTDNLNDTVVARLNYLQDEYIKDQKIIARNNNTTFDEDSFEKILISNPYANQNLPTNKKLTINRSSPIYEIYLREIQTNYANTAINKAANLKETAILYNATNYYKYQQVSPSYNNLAYLKNGVEDLSNIGEYKNPANSDYSEYGYTVSSVQNSSYLFLDDSIINKFILKPSLNTDNTSIPVVITSNEAVSIFGDNLGIKEEPSTDSIQQQIDWTKNLQNKINGLTYQVCYRNDASISELAQITQTLEEIDDNKNNPNYKMPSLVYNLPTEPCGDITIKSDTRTLTEKNQDEINIELQKKLSKYTKPEHHMFTFQVVGVIPVFNENESMKNLFSFTKNIFGSNYNSGAIIPIQMYNKLPDSTRREDILLGNQNKDPLEEADIVSMIVEFDNISDAKNFIKNEGCSTSDNICNKQFYLDAYGSNYLIIDDLKNTATSILSASYPIAIIIAGLVMSISMTRIIIDSRKETAIFRAIGAKRIDISAIYVFYSIRVAIRIILLSLTSSLLISFLINYIFSNQVTNYIQIIYGLFDNGKSFNFIGIPIEQLLILTACIFIISILAIIPAIIRNVRRNPIKDMRID